MKKFSYLLPLLLLLVILGSCKTNTQLTYFENNKPAQGQVMAQSDWKIKIEPDDELMILVTSEVNSTTEAFNLPASVGGDRTYIVNKEGDISMPKLGRIHVAGMTTTQLSEEVTRRVSEYVEAPLVRVTLMNFKVNVLGEVSRPQTVRVPGERYTILEALAAAGDLTVFGRRDNVTLIREKDGQVTYQTVDLTDADLVKSPYYYLQQNDVVYVEPNKVRKDQSEYSVNDSYKIQVVSAIVSGASVVVSLIIALAVK